LSSPKETVTLDAEFLLNRLEAVDRALADIKQAALQGYGRPASPAGININAIIWRNKYSDEVGPEASWAWAFSRDREGHIADEARQLVQEIERYEKVEVDGYEITLGGKDMTLLNRKKMKGGRR